MMHRESTYDPLEWIKVQVLYCPGCKMHYWVKMHSFYMKNMRGKMLIHLHATRGVHMTGSILQDKQHALHFRKIRAAKPISFKNRKNEKKNPSGKPLPLRRSDHISRERPTDLILLHLPVWWIVFNQYQM